MRLNHYLVAMAMVVVWGCDGVRTKGDETAERSTDDAAATDDATSTENADESADGNDGGDGSEGGTGAETPPVDDTTEPAPSAPLNWTCDVAEYADGGCDCGCGAFDPDCSGQTSATCETNHCTGDLVVANDLNDPCTAQAVRTVTSSEETVIEHADRTRATIPAGAVNEDVTITIENTRNPPVPLPANFIQVSDVISFLPHGTSFASDITLDIPFSYDGNRSQLHVLVLADASATEWTVEPQVSVERGAARVTTRSFSSRAVALCKGAVSSNACVATAPAAFTCSTGVYPADAVTLNELLPDPAAAKTTTYDNLRGLFVNDLFEFGGEIKATSAINNHYGYPTWTPAANAAYFRQRSFPLLTDSGINVIHAGLGDLSAGDLYNTKEHGLVQIVVRTLYNTGNSLFTPTPPPRDDSCRQEQEHLRERARRACE